MVAPAAAVPQTQAPAAAAPVNRSPAFVAAQTTPTAATTVSVSSANATCTACNLADQNAGAALNSGQQSSTTSLINALKQQQQPVVSLSTAPTVDPNLTTCLQALGGSTPAVSINDGIDLFFANRFHDHVVMAAANASLKDEIGTSGYQTFQKDYPACATVVTSAQFAARYSAQFKTP